MINIEALDLEFTQVDAQVFLLKSKSSTSSDMDACEIFAEKSESCVDFVEKSWLMMKFFYIERKLKFFSY